MSLGKRTNSQGLPAHSRLKTTQGLPTRSVLKMIHWIIFRAYLTHWTVFLDAAHSKRLPL